jgi:hypothetical protein
LAANLPSTRDGNTLYFVTDTGALYLGQNLIADKTGDYAAAIAALDATVKDESGLVKVTIVQEDGKLKSVTVNQADLLQKFEGYKTKQTAKSGTGSTTKTVTGYSQNANGEVEMTFADISFPTIPSISITDDNKADVPTEETVDVYKNLTASGHTLTEELVQVATKAAVDNALAAAKKYADDNDTNTAHAHTTKEKSGIKANGTGGIDGTTTFELNVALELDNKTIKLYDKDDATKTALATLDATSFIKDGMIKSVELVDKDGTGKAGKFLKITWNIDDANGTDADSNLDVVYVDVTTLVDVYTGSTTDNKDGINVKVENYNISAELGANVVNDIASGVAAQTTLSSGSVAISANGNTIKVSAFGKNSDAFTVPYATSAESASYADNANNATSATFASNSDLANDASKLGGKDPSYYEVSGTAATMIGSQQTGNSEATGVYAAIQGATTNTVRECVDAINKMNNIVDANGAALGNTIGTVENIVNQLTWGSFGK